MLLFVRRGLETSLPPSPVMVTKAGDVPDRFDAVRFYACFWEAVNMPHIRRRVLHLLILRRFMSFCVYALDNNSILKLQYCSQQCG